MSQIDVNTIKEVIETQDNREAVRILVAQKKAPEMKIDEDLLIQLQYVRMNSLNVKELLALLKTSILAIYSIPGYLLSERIDDYLEQLDDVPEEISFYESFVKLLESDEEVIGTSDLTVDGKKFTPSIRNFIKDYNFVTNQQAEKNALTEVQYFSGSKILNLLPENQRAVVKDIIKSYDDALKRLNEWNSTPEPKNAEETERLTKDFDLYKVIPGLKDELSEESVNTKSPSQVPKTEPVPQIVPQKQERTVSDFKIPLAKDLDLKAQPRRGLVFDQGTNVDIDETIKSKQEEEIQAKLEDLKQRKKK